MPPAFAIRRLRCEYLSDPLGIDERVPRLSWIVESDRRGARQVAYRVRVAGSRAALERGGADLWDSGRVESDRTAHVVYEGKPLASRMECHWCIHVWDEAGKEAVSEPALWTMGLLDPADWTARWIAADPEIVRRDPEAVEGTRIDPDTPALFRKAFTLPGPVRRATLYVSARGLGILRINGAVASDGRFEPEWTDYDKRLHYRAHDVTGLLRVGGNALAATLGDGWWSGYVGWQETRGRYGLENSLLAQLEVELESGERVTIVSDGAWRCETGPILSSDFMMGEVYDARRERTGWDAPDHDDAPWLPARVVDPPSAPLVAQRSESVRVVETIKPASTNEIAPGVWIFDMGQNFAGWVRLRVDGPAGTRVVLRHGERLKPDGTLYTENLRRAMATDTYVLKGGGEEIWEPHFTFHGFQYVEATGLPSPPRAGDLVGRVVHSATPPAGDFDCSHAGVNRLWLNGYWSQKGNFLSVPTDCPQRDERLGWMGDAQVFLRTATYNMDVAAFFSKWMIDVEDAQTAEGIFPDVAPRLKEDENFIGLDGLGGAAGWADAGVIVPWTIWRVYGDTRIVERHWDAMIKWVDWIAGVNPDGVRRNELGNNYGDWLCIPSDTSFRTQSPMKTLLATAYWADDAAKLARMARAIGREDEARRMEAMFERVRAAFQKEWLLEDGRLAVETQTAYLLALAFDLLSAEARERATEHLVDNIKALDWHLSTGFIGISHLNPILTQVGRVDVAWRLLLNEDYPSWLYPVLHGATTIWERWNGWTEEDGFFNPQMNSFNHYSLGSVGEWLYRSVAGIELDGEVEGFRRFVIRPHPGGGLTHAGASYRSMAGSIESRWRRVGKRLELEVGIPANARALVFVPSDPGTAVLEGGVASDRAEGVEPAGREGGFYVFKVQSGKYLFSSTWSAE
jgi:alpha-L-rhamnosidase